MDVTRIISHHTESDPASFPVVVIIDLCDGYIEAVPHPIDNLLEHLTLSLEGAILRNNHIEMTDAYDHPFSWEDMRILKAGGNLLVLIGFDDISLLHIVETLNANPTLISLLNVLDVFLETLEG